MQTNEILLFILVNSVVSTVERNLLLIEAEAERTHVPRSRFRRQSGSNPNEAASAGTAPTAITPNRAANAGFLCSTPNNRLNAAARQRRCSCSSAACPNHITPTTNEAANRRFTNNLFRAQRKRTTSALKGPPDIGLSENPTIPHFRIV